MRRVPTARLSALIAVALVAALMIACAEDDAARDAPAPAPEPAATVPLADAPAEDAGDADADANVETPAPPAPRAPGSDESNAAAAETSPESDPAPPPEPDEPPPAPDEPAAGDAESDAASDVAEAAADVPEEPAVEEGAAAEDGALDAATAQDAPAETVADDDAPAETPDEAVAASDAPPEEPAVADSAPPADSAAWELAAAASTVAPGGAEGDTPRATGPAPDDPTADDPAPAEPAGPLPAWSELAALLPEIRDAETVAVPEPPRLLVVLDAGHGGDETGAQAFGVIERDSNLDFAFRVEALLVEAGYDVLLTRRTRERVMDVTHEYPDAPDFVVNRPDLQARVDFANDAGADIFVSIHSNGHDDARASGVEVYWSRHRPHAAENQRLALALQESVLESLRVEAGYRAWDRGIREDTCWDISRWTGECEGLLLLGPATEIQRHRVVALGQDPGALGFAPGEEVLRSRATEMPAALLELLFITNEWEAGVLKNEIARQAMAIGIVRGIERYFAETAALAEAADAARAESAESAAGG
ncbi:MAG: hypothetical protein F4Y94_06335 [Chloroflexi bacterium]|nr:hypothetical protein [Chloroflexota bacterium]